MSSIIAIIPARAGSKGIKNKNLQKINGDSLVEIAAKVAINSGVFDKIIVSSDSKKIIEQATALGIEAPFIRSTELSNDCAEGIDVWRDAHLLTEKAFKQEFKYSVYLEPTCPLRTIENIRVLVAGFINSKFDSAVTVSKTPAHYAPEKTLIIKDHEFLNYYIKDGANYSNRHNILKSYYHRNGAGYMMTRNALINNKSIINSRTLPVVLNNHLINIDTIEDLNYCKFLCKR